MKILTVQHAVPTKLLSNEWVLEQVREHNRDRFSEEELVLLEQRLVHVFESAGTETRYGLARGEKAIDFALDAGRAAIDASGVSPQDVDLLLYVGVCRGWTEPSMASAVQFELKLVNAACFDIVDACASWLRALQVAHAYIRSGTYHRVMVVNCECSFVPYRDWELTSIEDLEHRAGGWTAGEAATATIVSDENPDDDFYFTFKNFGEYFRLCMFPLAMVEDFFPGDSGGRYVPMRFFSLSRELLGVTMKKIVEVYQSDSRLREGRYDIGFGHEASNRATALLAQKLRLPHEGYYSTHSRYGNTVSAAVPLGMSLALQENRLRRGQRVLVIVGASGVTVGFASFTF